MRQVSQTDHCGPKSESLALPLCSAVFYGPWCQLPAGCVPTWFLAARGIPEISRKVNISVSKFSSSLSMIINCTSHFASAFWHTHTPPTEASRTSENIWMLMPFSRFWVHVSLSRWRDRASNTCTSRRHRERRCHRNTERKQRYTQNSPREKQIEGLSGLQIPMVTYPALFSPWLLKSENRQGTRGFVKTVLNVRFGQWNKTIGAIRWDWR